MLTGDTLFVGDIARPDLAIEKAEGARGIFRSLHEQAARRCPAECEVWPGHLGGSMCGGPGMDMKISSTIGYERAPQPDAGDRRRGRVRRAGARRARPAAAELPERSSRSTAAPLLTDGVEVLPLAPRQVEQQRAAGALLVDVRTDQQFDDAHIPGAVCNPMLTAGFGTKLAWLADREQRDRVRRPRRRGRPARRRGSRCRSGSAGSAGYLHGGMTSWRQEKRADRADRADAARGAAGAAERVQILDVRERSEWDAGHIPGSAFTP